MLDLKDLIKYISYEILQGDLNKLISGFQYNSQKVEKDNLFVCVKGFQSDGHKFASMAVEKGACAIICERELEFNVPSNVTVIKVENSRKTLSYISTAFYENPWEKLKMIGVTGTNGKTTITYLVEGILNLYNKKVGVIGTIENKIGEKIIPTERTTPEAKELQELFSLMVEEKVSHCVMEVSSHALHLHRVGAMKFDVGVFTNLSQDHLDYHENMENYKNAKAILFENSLCSVINIDDEVGEFMLEKAFKNTLTYSINKPSQLKAKNIEFSSSGTKFDLEYDNKEFEIKIATPGKFSVYNSLGAIGACIFLGIPMEIIIESLGNNKGVAGRFQSITSADGVQVVVDYAHTPDGLENILKTAKEFTKGKIITVFGCGGDRDKTKRPLMGKVASENSDYIIITSDNPRGENPELIAKDVENGFLKESEYEIILERQKAIEKAIKMGNENDIIIIAGKGHENYQIFKDETIHFDDMEEVKKILL